MTQFKMFSVRALLIMAHSLDLVGTHEYLVGNTRVFWLTQFVIELAL